MIYILLPAYNEEEGIERLLERIYRIKESYKLNLKLIVVNDGSQDNTKMVIDSFKECLDLDIINFETNKGIQKVFYEGFKRVSSLSADDHDICITMDSDNTHNPYYLIAILEKLKEPYDVVIASRFVKGGGMQGVPVHRELLSVAASYLMKKFVPIPGVSDYSTFYRGYRVPVLKKALEKHNSNLIFGEGFSGVVNMLIKLNDMGAKFGEVPFRLNYFLKEGYTGMSLMKTAKGYLKIIYRQLYSA